MKFSCQSWEIKAVFGRLVTEVGKTTKNKTGQVILLHSANATHFHGVLNLCLLN